MAEPILDVTLKPNCDIPIKKPSKVVQASALPQKKSKHKRIRKCMRHYSCTCVQKRAFLGKDLTIVEWGEEKHLKECTWPELTQP